MENTIKYVQLYLYNNVAVSEECLCVGVLFHNLTTGERTFNGIKNFKRLRAFNDDIDVSFMKAYLAGLKAQVETEMFYLNTSFVIENFIKSFVGELKFYKITTCKTEDENFIENTTKVLLKHDFARNERLSEEDESKVIKNLIKSTGNTYSLKTLKGTYNDDIKFDFITGKYCVKIFDFKDRETLKRQLASARNWSYIADELNVEGKYEAVFLYTEPNDRNSQEFNSLLGILSQNTKNVMELEKGISFLIQTNGIEKIV